jgi:hypothetical protein
MQGSGMIKSVGMHPRTGQRQFKVVDVDPLE